MSHDLFAAFGEPPGPQNVSREVPQVGEASHSLWRSDAVSTGEQDEDDDFGDFEDASATEPPTREPQTEKIVSTSVNAGHAAHKAQSQFPPKAQTRAEPAAPLKDPKIGKHPFADHMDFLFSGGGDDEYDAGVDELNDLANNPEAAMAYSKRIIAQQMEREGEGPSSVPNLPFAPKSKPSVSKPKPSKPSGPAPSPNKLRKKSGYAPAKASSVLFDIDNLSEEGDKEDDDDFGDFTAAVVQPSPTKTVPTTKSVMPRIDLLGLDDPFSNDAGLDGLTSPRQRRAASLLGMPKDSRPSNLATHVAVAEENDAWDDFETPEPTYPVPPMAAPTSKSIQPPENKSADLPLVPPTTIPPPSVLLSLSHKIFSQMTASPQSSIAHSYALAHILAGRKSRWKRDNILASSMRIGSAAGKGMKLAGVDRAEMAREEREVAECVRGWKTIVGKVRGKGLHVPEMAETMVVKVLGMSEGGLKGNRACALCGLRREERVKGVDVGVEDCFGEWWVEGMEMHVSCREFWAEFREELKSR